MKMYIKCCNIVVHMVWSLPNIVVLQQFTDLPHLRVRTKQRLDFPVISGHSGSFPVIPVSRNWKRSPPSLSFALVR
jgi:hypothetical protein